MRAPLGIGALPHGATKEQEQSNFPLRSLQDEFGGYASVPLVPRIQPHALTEFDTSVRRATIDPA